MDDKREGAIRQAVALDGAALSTLFAAAHYRGQGIGAALLAGAERRTAIAGCTQMTRTSREQRTDAHRVYGRAGYRARRKPLCKWLREGGC